jgi:hypothetical protein
MGRTIGKRTQSGLLTPLLVAAALVVGVAPVSSAEVEVPGPEAVGHWTAPFEEGGAETPRCHDDGGRVVCKPVGQAASVLSDGRVFYINGLEGDENVERSFVVEGASYGRNALARVLDLRSGVPQWAVPSPEGGGGTNPAIRSGHRSTDDPLGMAGVPGRPGDGLVGSTWGSLGGPPHEPSSPPDDPQDNDTDLFCSDLTNLPDGRVLVGGGSDFYSDPDLSQKDWNDPTDVGASDYGGLPMGRVFDHRTGSFTSTEPMKYGRWYPSMISLADGKVLMTSGVVRLVKTTQASQVRRTETYDPATNRWAENYTGPESENSLPLYPRLWLAPNGKVFYGATGQVWNPFGEAVDEATWALQQFFDPATERWEVAGVAPFGFRGTTGDVMLPLVPPYDKMTVLGFGGTLGPAPGSYLGLRLSTLTTVDRSGRVTTEPTGDLNIGRWFPSGVLLPDGQVFTANGADRDGNFAPGSEIAMRTSELYDPRTGRWATVPGQARDRTYHSSALLLPDARVLIGGHAPLTNGDGYHHDNGRPFANNDKDSSFEVWSPPYLFRGSRPVIESAPAGVAWGETFPVRTPQAGEVESVELMRLPSVQHTIDADQRAVMLPFTRNGDVLQVAAPPGGTVAPPGHYYLFINRRTAAGPVPSVARIVAVGPTSDSAEATQPMPDDAPAPDGSATPDEDTSPGAAVVELIAASPAGTVRGHPGATNDPAFLPRRRDSAAAPRSRAG